MDKFKNYFYQQKPGGADNDFLKIKVSYQRGGMNYFSGRGETRGIYLIFQNVKRHDRGGYCMEEYGLFESFKILALELTRANARRVNQVCSAVDGLKDEIFKLYAAGDRPALLDMVRDLGAGIMEGGRSV